MTNQNIPGIHQYKEPAGGWGALRATAKAIREQMEAPEAVVALLRTNKPDGLRLPGLRLAGQGTHLHLSVLRERREGRHLGGHQEARNA